MNIFGKHSERHHEHQACMFRVTDDMYSGHMKLLSAQHKEIRELKSLCALELFKTIDHYTLITPLSSVQI